MGHEEAQRSVGVPQGNVVKRDIGQVIARHVLRVTGYTYNDVKASFTNSYTDSVEQMKDNRMHVFALGTGIPASSIMDLASARDIKLVPVDDKTMAEMTKQNPGYIKRVIKAGTYPKQDKDVPVIGYSTHIVAACDLPEDMIYRITKAMAENVDDMAAVVKPIAGLTPKDMAIDIGVPFHKGATKYYKEKGVWRDDLKERA